MQTGAVEPSRRATCDVETCSVACHDSPGTSFRRLSHKPGPPADSRASYGVRPGFDSLGRRPPIQCECTTTMSTLNRSAETPTEYHDRLCEATNGIDVMTWKALKSIVYSLFFAAVGLVAVRNGADPGTMGLAVIIASGAVVVGELKEVEIANVATLTFKNGHGKEED